MALLTEIAPGLNVEGILPGAVVEIKSATLHGDSTLEVFFRRSDGSLGEAVLRRNDEKNLTIVGGAGRSLEADAGVFKLAAEAQRIQYAGLYDPMVAVMTSEIEPLPHQLNAVYRELLPRTPLRFLLADDPGAGKTIMAGLYIKELKLREDVHRCLIVAPGGLVEQWQDELYTKFGLWFEIFERHMVDSPLGGSVFDKHPFLIVRVDQLARNDELIEDFESADDWDLVVVDEAHRMSAHYYPGKIEKTKKFELGEKLGMKTRHLLLMTATPHAGKEDDFQLFLTLLDRDRFEGKYKEGVHASNTDGIMRRMIKEDLLTFEGKPLFPERIAETVTYELSDEEQELYESVTEYVREGMNRAKKLDAKRRNTVGFALTILQRRLASSPEAILRSLERRFDRLTRWKERIESGELVDDELAVFDEGIDSYDDEFATGEQEDLEEQILDAATAAATIEELITELAELEDLIAQARHVRSLETDRKWSELRKIIEDESLASGPNGDGPRKLIIFTEHRDTLEYLKNRISSLVGRPEAVVSIHGGVQRKERRQITEEFTHNSDCQILLATDAAGEGLNLQAAHLMVNYDLPWNPNRIEQRFGRIHRIGQKEVCRLWNLVAGETREGQVFVRLLAKIEEQRKAYDGKVFDVLGGAFTETPLRELLLDAILYGDDPEVRAKMEQTIDENVAEGIQELLDERQLAKELSTAEIAELKEQMDEAKARRLQPHYIESAFRQAFKKLGGRMVAREAKTFEITNVPAKIRQRAKGPVASKYRRVTFDFDEGVEDAELIAPGHPLHDAVLDLTIEEAGEALSQGTVLVSSEIDAPQLLVGLIEQVDDATGNTLAKRFGYAFVDIDGAVTDAGPAPYLDCVKAPETDEVIELRKAEWLAEAEQKALSWIMANRLGEYVEEVRTRRLATLEQVRELVDTRLKQEENRLISAATKAKEDEAAGKKVKESEASLMRKAVDINTRREDRLALIEKERQINGLPPRVEAAALVLPLDMFTEDEETEDMAPLHAKDTKEVERRGVDLVLATEAKLGRDPEEQPFNNPGFDVLSRVDDDLPIRIEVKARLAGAKDFYVTHNEVITGLNTQPRYRLAMVKVDPRGPEHDEVRYLDNPFLGFQAGEVATAGLRILWDKEWAKAKEPF